MDWPEIAGDARFFQRAGPHTLAAVADAANAKAPPRRLVLAGVAPLQSAGPAEVSFRSNRKYLAALEHTGAGAVVLHPDLTARVPATAVPLATDEPYAAWARVAALFHPLPSLRPGMHPSAVVAEDALIDPSAEIGPLAVIGAGVEIGPRCRIAPLAVLRRGVVLGPDCRIGPMPASPTPCSVPGSMSIRARESARKASGSRPRRRGSAACHSLAG